MEKRKKHIYKKLKIWQLAMEVCNDVFEITDKFPKEEKFGLISQLNRCAVSIPGNIAEGSSRSNPSFSHFLGVALGSSYELVTQLIISSNRKYINNKVLAIIENKIDELQKMMVSFSKNTLNSFSLTSIHLKK